MGTASTQTLVSSTTLQRKYPGLRGEIAASRDAAGNLRDVRGTPCRN